MNEIIKHPEFGTIRTEIIGGAPWFCAKDVCIALGYENHKDALKRHCRQEGGSETLPPKLKGVLKCSTPTVSGIQEMNFIDEGNLYRLILKSRLPAAERFESWVCDEVLPAIRRTGEFRMAPTGKKKRVWVNADIIHLLWLIDENLMSGDKSDIALQIGVSRQSIHNVLNGQSRSPRILMALYKRALENRKSGLKNPYSQDFTNVATYKLL